MEIERKYLLSALPPRALLGEGRLVQQGYLESGLRLRLVSEECFLTLKGEGTLAREEWEDAIPRWVFDQLWPGSEGHRLEKIRYRVPHGDLELEVDEYLGPLAGLVTLECEFDSVASAGRLVLPDWAADAREVTEDRRYRNSHLASFGLPEPPRGR